MLKTELKILVLVAVGFMAFNLYADNPPTPAAPTVSTPTTPAPTDQGNLPMEKCKVVDADGNGLIKPYMADSGLNLQGDADAWIWVPYGQCAKINKGDFSQVSPDIAVKIDASNVQRAITLGK